MINDYNIEFMVGDVVEFTPAFELFSDMSEHNTGVVSSIHGHQIWIDIQVSYDGVKEHTMNLIRLSNDIKRVVEKAEVQLTLLD